jgi:hypothetical protein
MNVINYIRELFFDNPEPEFLSSETETESCKYPYTILTQKYEHGNDSNFSSVIIRIDGTYLQLLKQKATHYVYTSSPCYNPMQKYLNKPMITLGELRKVENVKYVIAGTTKRGKYKHYVHSLIYNEHVEENEMTHVIDLTQNKNPVIVFYTESI